MIGFAPERIGMSGFVARRYALVLVCNFLFSFEAAVTEYGAAAIATGLKVGPVEASAFLFWYFMAAAVGVAAAPWIAARVRPERALWVTLAAAAGCVVLGAQAHSAGDFTLMRVGLGLLQANMGVLLGLLIVQGSQVHERHEIFAATGVGIGLGYLAAPLALAAAAHAGGSWRHAYVAAACGMLVLLPLLWRLVRRSTSPQPSPGKVDPIDLLSIASLVLVLASGAMLLHPSSPLPGGGWRALWVVLGVTGTWGVLWTSTRCDSPALDVQLIRHSDCGPFLVAGLLSFCATFLVAFIAPYLALYSASARADVGALLLVAFPIGFALGGAATGRVGAAFKPGQMAVWAHAGCAVASLVGAWLVRFDSPAVLALAYLASGTLRGATLSPMATLATLQVPMFRLSSLLSTAAVFRSTGMLLGVGLAAHTWRLSGLESLVPCDLERDAQHLAVANLASLVYLSAAALQAIATALLLRYRRLS
jgi:Major Facilitator Superfamily